MPRVSIHEEDSAEAHLVKVDPGGTFERFLEQAESRLGFRPTAVYLKGTRVQSVEDLEEDDKLSCCKTLHGKENAAPSSASAPAPTGASADPNILNLKVVSPGDEMHLRVKQTTKLIKIYKAVADRKGMPGPTGDGTANESLAFRLLFDGERLNPSLTPADYNMEEGDTIDYFVQAEGGGGLETACTEAMRQPGVIGVMCVDEQGLCLQSQGTVPEVSGCVAELAKQAQVLCQGDEGTVVSVESAERKVLLSRVGGVTTAIFMRPGGVA
jgi:small ubiquitin-related modifier